MRAVKSIITAAGHLKRKNATQAEDVLVLQAIVDVNLPKFVQADLQLATAIFGDLFMGVSLPVTDYSVLMQGVSEASKKSNLQVNTLSCRGEHFIRVQLTHRSANGRASHQDHAAVRPSYHLHDCSESLTHHQLRNSVCSAWCHGRWRRNVHEVNHHPRPC
jgi:hypothetical protein